MGLFSSKYVTTVGTSIARLVEDPDVVDPAVLAIQTALFKNEDVVDHILESTLNNMSFKVEQAYRYGGSNYIYGLPSGEIFSSSFGLSEARDVLSGIEGSPVTIDYIHYGPFNSIHAGWIYLIHNYGYNTQTNELTALSAQKGWPVYLKDMVLEIPSSQKDIYSPDSYQVWGRPPNSGYLPTTAWNLSDDLAFIYRAPTLPEFKNIATERLRIVYLWVEESWQRDFEGGYTYRREEKEESIYIPIPAHNPDASYFHVRYYDSNSIPKYWTYRDGAGTYPVLDAVYTDSPIVMGDFYPNIYFRLEKSNPANNPESPQFLSSKKLAKKIDLDYAKLVDQIHENPDIGDVEQAILTLAVPAESTHPLEQEYLFDFFDKLHLNGSGNGEGDFLNNYLRQYYFAGAKALDEALKSIVIQDGAFKMALRYLHTTKARKVGQIGPVGFCNGERGEYELTREAIVQNDVGTTVQLTERIPYHVYRKQVALNFYEEVTVVGLRMRYSIYGKYDNTMGDDDEDDVAEREIILVPLDRSITREYPPGKQHELYIRSLHFVFNSRVVTKVKWYQRGVFKTLLKVAGIVLTVMSFGADGGFFAAAGAALAAGAYATVITLIITEIVTYLVVQELFKIFVKAVGLEGAFIAAVFAAAYGVYSQMASGAKGITATAKDMLWLANGLVEASTSVLKSMYEDLQSDWDTFQKESKEALQTLEESRDVLFKDINMVPLVILGETPDNYLRRTAYSGNIGMLAVDDVSNYVNRSLQLPTIA